jgi:nicotinate-nucleotide adenylyltransferase
MPDSRVGILGGTFDPIHLGHLIPAMYAIGHLALDRLYLVPSAAPVHRPRHTPAPAEDRLRLCELAVRNLPRFRVCDIEVRRPEPSYTVLTLQHFRKTLGDAAQIFLLVGEDNLPLLATWHRAADLPRLARLAILPRRRPGPAVSGASPPGARPVLAWTQPPMRVPSPLVPISATDLRDGIRQGIGVAGLVPASVAAYIHLHGLYRS